jgi:hypothetical protein
MMNDARRVIRERAAQAESGLEAARRKAEEVERARLASELAERLKDEEQRAQEAAAVQAARDEESRRVRRLRLDIFEPTKALVHSYFNRLWEEFPNTFEVASLPHRGRLREYRLDWRAVPHRRLKVLLDGDSLTAEVRFEPPISIPPSESISLQQLDVGQIEQLVLYLTDDSLWSQQSR